ncbi:MAG: FtsX-like permease family protein [Actinomycetota bacterium]
MSALGRVVRSGVGRKRVQTAVIGLVVMMCVTAAVLAGSLIVASNGPFDRAFAQQHGAHLAAQFDASRTTTAAVAATAAAPGVTASGGPFGTATITPASGGRGPSAPITVVGRGDPGGAVDKVTVTAGRWVSAPGEIVLFSDGRQRGPFRTTIGTTLRLPELPGSPTLTVVGLARSVSETAGGWVLPAQATALSVAGAPGGYQMLYRFTAADSTTQMTAHRDAVEKLLPAGAMTGTRSWLTTRRAAAGPAALLVPFLIAFGLLGIVMAILIVGNVIAGAVSTGTRRIGILKALGFTPDQVVRAYVGQALIPAAVGAALGVVAGIILTIPVLAETDKLYGTKESSVIPWLDAAVVVGALLVVALTALAAASRAGRLRTVEALSVGRTPRQGRGQRAARLTGRFRLPRPVTLGLARPFARPAQAGAMVVAIALGAAAATFAVGLGTSLNRVQANDSHGDVVVRPAPPEGSSGPPGARKSFVPIGKDGPPPLDSTVATVIGAQAATTGYCGVAETEVTVAGLTGALGTRALTGDGCSHTYPMVSGRWYTQPGEIVVSTPFLTATGTTIGDTIALTDHGTGLTVRIVGEVFNTDDDGMQVLTAAATVASAEPELGPLTYDVTVAPGTDVGQYTDSLNNALAPAHATAEAAQTGSSDLVIVINSLTTILTVMLIAVAGLGVLNMVVLETRERVHDLGVAKALGMTPRQTISMVLASVVVIGLVGGVLGTPIGVLVHKLVMTDMGRAAGFNLPPSIVEVYRSGGLALFVLGGVVIAVVGALLPAGWAAKTRTATALRTE